MLAVLLIFTACSSAAQNTGSDAPAEEASEETSEQPAEEASDAGQELVRLKYTFWGSPQEKKAQEGAIEQFNKKYEGRIQVEGVHIPTSYDEKLTTMIAGNEAPDVAFLESATLAYPLAEEGKLLNLVEFLEVDPEMNMDAIVPNIEFYWAPDKMLGIGAAPEVFQLFYNVDMLAEAGVEAPPADPANAWDWDTFVENAKKLTIDQNGNNALSPDFDPNKIQQYGVNVPLWWGTWGSFVIANGGDFVTADGKLGLTQPEAIEAIQRVSDLINVHHVAPSPVQAKSLPAPSVSLQTKKVAMAIDGAWVNLDFGVSKVNYAVGALPKMNDGSKSLVVTAAVGIFSSTQHPDEAWTFLKHMINPDNVSDLITSGLWMPAMKDWYTDAAKLSGWAEGNAGHPAGFKENAVGNMLNGHGHPTPTSYVIDFNKIMDKVNPALDKVWLGEMSAEEALKSVEAQAQAEVKGRRDQ